MNTRKGVCQLLRGDKFLATHNTEHPGINRLNPAVFDVQGHHYLHKKNAHLVPKLDAVLKTKGAIDM